jgi:hypothetical protein
LDEVNKLPVDRSSELIPILRDYLSFSYALSDKCRKEWRNNQRVPDVSALERMLITDVPNFTEVEDGHYTYSSTEVENELERIKAEGDQLLFTEAFTDKDEKARVKGEIITIMNQRKAKRPQQGR